MAQGSHKVVYAAIVSNVAVCIGKFIVAGLSGSAALLAEAFHSAADSANEVLLLIGLKRSTLPPDDEHPFGHGREVYFWSFIVAMSIFAVGGGLSILEGIQRMFHPEPLKDPKWSYIVLGIAFALEGYSWIVSTKELSRRRSPGQNFIEAIQLSKDPSVFTVVIEDTGALLGLVVAFLGVWLSHILDMPVLDAVASVVVGILLVLAALLLAHETGGLLLGESVNKHTMESLRAIIANDPAVRMLGKTLTMQLGPEEVLLAADVSFQPQLAIGELESAIDRIEQKIREEHPAVKHLYFEAERMGGKNDDRQRAA
jgi:cation diffusion facilitator family transporter